MLLDREIIENMERSYFGSNEEIINRDGVMEMWVVIIGGMATYEERETWHFCNVSSNEG